MRLAKALVLAWTHLYTAGLPEEMRLRRCTEIESDVWEFENDPERPRFAGAHLVLRLLGGLWHDLGWRLEQRTPHVAPQQLMLSGTPRHPVIVTSAFTCSLTVHLVAGAAAIWLVSYPFHRPSAISRPGAESAAALAPVFSGPDDDQAASTASPPTEADTFIAMLLRNRYALSVRRGQLSGAGADVLRSAIAQSRFVLLGESHGNRQTPKFWGAVCNAAGPAGFRTMAVEEDAVVAAELEAWAKLPDGLAQLQAFEKRFPESVHIYSAREEFETLQQCARAGQGDLRLWGLNQSLIEINRGSPADYGNARRRERVMKTRFAANYAQAASTAAAPPKVLLKFGAFHIYRGLNPAHGSGIGNYVAEFAEGQGAESLHIRLMPVTGSQPMSRHLQPMLDNLLPSGWTMFDLRPLRHGLNAPGSWIHPDLATLVFGYDLLVMVSDEATPSTKNR